MKTEKMKPIRIKPIIILKSGKIEFPPHKFNKVTVTQLKKKGCGCGRKG
jgi:hypothetical protein